MAHTAAVRNGFRSPVVVGLCVVASSAFGLGFTTDTIRAAPRDAQLSSDDVEVFVGIDPLRLLDTRSGVGASAIGPLRAQEIRSLPAAGIGTIPSNATSIAINTTLPAASSSPAFITIWPTGTPQPKTSVNNATPGQAVPNFAISRLGDGGAVNIFNETGDTHIVIDVVGFYAPLSSVTFDTPPGGALHTGLGAPSNSMGDNGDYYIEQTEADMYEKEAGAWGDPIVELGPDHSAPEVFAGDGAPSDSLGKGGDVYFDTAALTVYGPKGVSAWGAGRSIGPDGVGSTFLSGVVAPSNKVGANGDMYLDTTTLVLHGPKSGGTWAAATPLTTGADLLVGSGIPGPLDGVDGDIYLDEDTLTLYGPKSDDSWGVGSDLNGAPTALTDSALSARGDAAALALKLTLGEFVVPFPTDGVSVGSAISRAGDGTFTFVDAGTYKVSFSFETLLVSALGDVELRVDGAATPDSFILASLGTPASGTALVHADAGDTLEIVRTGVTVAAGASANGSLIVELIAVD